MTKDSLAYVIPLPPVPALSVLGANGLFPVTRIFCLGRNYADHAREMGGNPDREPPFFFMKPANALLSEGQDFPYPSQSENVHYEFELVVAIGAGGVDISKDAALGHVFGYAAGLDDSPRSPAAGREKFASLGDRQGFRSFRSLFAGRARQPHRPSR